MSTGGLFLQEYFYATSRVGAGEPMVHEKGVSFHPEIVFFRDLLNERDVACTVCLFEAGGTHRFGIGVVPYEGEALQVELERKPSQQAVTHRAVAAVTNVLGGHLLYVVVNNSAAEQEAGYIGELYIKQVSTEVAVNVTASDAIILAVICDAPIIVSNDILAGLDKSPPRS